MNEEERCQIFIPCMNFENQFDSLASAKNCACKLNCVMQLYSENSKSNAAEQLAQGWTAIYIDFCFLFCFLNVQNPKN